MATITDKVPTLTAARAALKNLGADLLSAATDTASASQRVCITLARIERLFLAVPKLGDAAEQVAFCERHTERLLRPDEVSQYRTAGRVYLSLTESGATVDSSVSKSALGLLHKVLAAPASDLGGMTGADAVAACWTDAAKSDGTATIAAIGAVIGKRFPKVEGSRGPKSGSAAASGNGKAPAKPATVEAPKPEAGEQKLTASRKGAALTAANRHLSAFEAAGVSRFAAWTFADKLADIAERQGVPALRAALADCKPEAPKPERKPRTRKNGSKA